MSYIYFHTATNEAIEQAITDGVPVICSGGARDLPQTRRGQLWSICQGPRELEVRLRKDRSNVEADSVIESLDNERENFIGEDNVEIEDFS